MWKLGWSSNSRILWWYKCSPNCNFHSFVGRKKERYPSDWETLPKLGSSNLNFAPISWHTFLNCSPPPHTNILQPERTLKIIQSHCLSILWDFLQRGEMLKSRFLHLKGRGKVKQKQLQLKERSRLWVWPRSHQTNGWKMEKSNVE